MLEMVILTFIASLPLISLIVTVATAPSVRSSGPLLGLNRINHLVMRITYAY
jgi:hypothetical protein